MDAKLSTLIYTLILFPLIGAMVIFLMPKNRSELFQPLAIFLSIIPFSVCLYLFSNVNSKSSYQQFDSINWISSYGIKISFGFSGMSHLLLSLTSVLILLSFLSVTEDRKSVV